MCKRVNAHKERKEGKGNGKQKIENRNSQFPFPTCQLANVLTCKLANFPTCNFVMPNLDRLGVKLNNFIASIKKKTRID